MRTYQHLQFKSRTITEWGGQLRFLIIFYHGIGFDHDDYFCWRPTKCDLELPQNGEERLWLKRVFFCFARAGYLLWSQIEYNNKNKVWMHKVEVNSKQFRYFITSQIPPYCTSDSNICHLLKCLHHKLSSWRFYHNKLLLPDSAIGLWKGCWEVEESEMNRFSNKTGCAWKMRFILII